MRLFFPFTLVCHPVHPFRLIHRIQVFYETLFTPLILILIPPDSHSLSSSLSYSLVSQQLNQSILHCLIPRSSIQPCYPQSDNPILMSTPSPNTEPASPALVPKDQHHRFQDESSDDRNLTARQMESPYPPNSSP